MKNLTNKKSQELKTLKKTQESSDLDFSEDYFMDRENRAEIVNNYKKKKCKN